MKEPRDLLKIQAYLDQELSFHEQLEIEKLLHADPEARLFHQRLAQTRDLLRENEPAPTLPESCDFYWSKIRRAIEAAERGQLRETRPLPKAAPWWRRLALGGAAAALIFLFLVLTGRETSTTRFAQAGAEEIPATNTSAFAFQSEIDGMTIVWLQYEFEN